MRDKIGILFSSLCVFHCLITFLLIYGGIGSVAYITLSEEYVHPILLVIILIVGMYAFPPAFRKHKSILPMSLGFIGIAGLISALFISENLEVAITTISGLILVIAHNINRRILIS